MQTSYPKNKTKMSSTMSNSLQSSNKRPHTSTTTTRSFNDATSSDVILHLISETETLELFLHSDILRRCNYFSALLSERWLTNPQNDTVHHLTLHVSPNTPLIKTYKTVLKLLYTNDFRSTVTNASTALDIVPVALELLFEDCVKFCVKFLECVPWTESEEERVIALIPLLSHEESRELIARVFPTTENLREEMLHGLINQAINHSNTALVKAFVAKLLREFPVRDVASGVLEKAFGKSLKVVKESLEEYSSPDFRGDHNETEAIQRLNLHTAMTNGRHLLWLIERMVELGVADVAVREWSDQAGFTADLQRAFRDDAWRNIVPGLPGVVLRCTGRLANAVANGSTLVDKEVRMRLVRDWLPVLVICKENISPMLPSPELYLELEETFLRIISTLPMSDSQELLQQCLSFSTRSVDDCRHLITAFQTWFRRASQSSYSIKETCVRRDVGSVTPDLLPSMDLNV